jgi:hypothetical protein
MKKILSGFLGIVASLAFISIAYALTFNQVSISGLAFTMEDPYLQIAGDGTSSFGDNYTVPSSALANLRPGEPAIKIPFTLKNTSSYKMTLTPLGSTSTVYSGPYDPARELSFNILVAIVPASITTDDEIKNLPASPTGPGQWYDLGHMIESGGYQIYGDIEAGQTKDFNIWIKIPDDPSSKNIAGQTLSDIQFTLTGALVK